MAYVDPDLHGLLALLKQLRDIRHDNGVLLVSRDLREPRYTLALEVMLRKEEGR